MAYTYHFLIPIHIECRYESDDLLFSKEVIEVISSTKSIKPGYNLEVISALEPDFDGAQAKESFVHNLIQNPQSIILEFVLDDDGQEVAIE